MFAESHRIHIRVALCHAALWLTALLATPAHALIYKVGSGSGCTHSTIQAAVTAAQANPGADVIRVTRTLTYSAQQVTVNTAQDLTIMGGFASCTQVSSDGIQTVLSGAGGSAAPVISITSTAPSLLRIYLLRLTDGDTPDTGGGGGIRFNGGGTLELANMAIDNNRAGAGGGVYFLGTGENAALVIGNNNIINSNTAIDGGGVYLQQGEMTMNATGSSIWSNTATHAGGGLRIYGTEVGTSATIGSTGFSGLAAIQGNQAQIGGGISLQGLIDGGSGNASILLETVDPAKPVRVRDNFASQRGGGIDLQNYGSYGNAGDVYATANGALIEFNFAPLAPAVFVGTYNSTLEERGSQFYMHGGRISDNIGADANNNRTTSAMVIASADTVVRIDHVAIQRNIGGPFLRVGEAQEVLLRSLLISGNDFDGTGQGSVLSIDRAEDFQITNSTIAGNTLSAEPVFWTSGAFGMARMVIWQPGRTTMQGGATANFDDILASELASLGSSVAFINADPRFIDPAHADYHLQAASPAVDFAGLSGGNDLDGNTRDRDLDRVPNVFGPGDLGTYERLTIGNLVLNAGFATDLRLWNESLANGTTVRDAAGSDGSPGSVTVSGVTPLSGDLIGISQCVRIPGPGRYRLSGAAYGDGDAATRDRPYVYWALRPDTGNESCSGTVAAQGALAFPSSATFAIPAESVYIDIPAGQWTQHTAVEVSLRVGEGSNEHLTVSSAHFDNIVLEPTNRGPSQLFSDGFED